MDGDDETVLTTLQCSLRDPLRRVARKVRKRSNSIAGRPSWPTRRSIYGLRNSTTRPRRRRGFCNEQPKRRSKSPARLEDTLEAIVENEDRAWARVDDDERKSPRKSRRRYRFWPSSSSKRTTTAKRELVQPRQHVLHGEPPRWRPVYAASGEYAFDLNTESKYSPKGVLAAAFGDLVSALQKEGRRVPTGRFGELWAGMTRRSSPPAGRF